MLRTARISYDSLQKNSKRTKIQLLKLLKYVFCEELTIFIANCWSTYFEQPGHGRIIGGQYFHA